MESNAVKLLMCLYFSEPYSGCKVTENENRWLIIGIALNRFMVPNLTRIVKKTMDEMYTFLKTSQNIHQQTHSNPYVKHCNIDLHYNNINSNFKHKSPWDYKVTCSFDLARLFFKEKYMAKCTSFDEWDMSGLLRLICVVDDSSCEGIFKGVRKEAKNIRDIRNSWAHCHLPSWHQQNYDDSFATMDILLKKLKVSPDIRRALLGLKQNGRWQMCKEQHSCKRHAQKFNNYINLDAKYNLEMKYNANIH